MATRRNKKQRVLSVDDVSTTGLCVETGFHEFGQKCKDLAGGTAIDFTHVQVNG